MLTFFKTNDPYRLLGVVLLLLIIRVPMLFSEVPFIIPELKWLLIGERLGSDDFLMYRDLWDSTAPLAVVVYKWLYLSFGKSRLSFQVLSIILVILQAGIFNHIMLKNKAYPTSNYVPALVYMLLMNAFFDLLTLSPILMGMTFILLALNNLFKRIDNKTKDEMFILTGVYLGVATLFFLPSFFYFLVTLIALVIFTGSILRRVLLLVYGYAVVIIVAGIYFHWFDSYLIFQHHFFKSIWKIESVKYFDFTDFIVLTAVPLSILMVSVFQMFKIGKYINYQMKIQQVMFLFFLSGGLAMWCVREASTYQLIYFVPTTAFVISHYLLAIKNWLMAELNFLVIAILIVFNQLFITYDWLHVNEIVSLDELKVTPSEYSIELTGKKVLVLGSDMHHYQDASLATPYLNWGLAQIQLNHLNYYDNAGEVFVNLENDLPEVIVDQEGRLLDVFNVMPTIAARYNQHEQYPELYLLKP